MGDLDSKDACMGSDTRSKIPANCTDKHSNRELMGRDFQSVEW